MTKKIDVDTIIFVKIIGREKMIFCERYEFDDKWNVLIFDSPNQQGFLTRWVVPMDKVEYVKHCPKVAQEAPESDKAIE